MPSRKVMIQKVVQSMALLVSAARCDLYPYRMRSYKSERSQPRGVGSHSDLMNLVSDHPGQEVLLGEHTGSIFFEDDITRYEDIYARGQGAKG
jgi:hypothetical protein